MSSGRFDGRAAFEYLNAAFAAAMHGPPRAEVYKPTGSATSLGGATWAQGQGQQSKPGQLAGGQDLLQELTKGIEVIQSSKPSA